MRKVSSVIAVTALACGFYTNAANAQEIRSCSVYGFWQKGTLCKRKSGQICTVTGIIDKKLQLSCR